MSSPTPFPQSNFTFVAPEGMMSSVLDLPVYRQEGGVDSAPMIISCWRLNRDERAEVGRTGRVWLWIHSGAQPPVSVSGTHPWPPDDGG